MALIMLEYVEEWGEEGMLRLALVFLVLACGAIVFQVAALSVLWAANPWFKAAPVLVPFAALVATVFFSANKDAWVAALARTVASGLQRRPWALYVVTAVLCGIAILFGEYVWSVSQAKEGKIAVQVYQDIDLPNQAVPGLPIELEQKLRPETLTTTTDSRGMASFQVDVGDYFAIRIRESSDPNARVAVLDSNLQVSDKTKTNFLPVRLDDFTNAWIDTKKSARSGQENDLQFVQLPSAYFRWRDAGRRPHVIDVDEDAPSFPFEVPGAETILRRKAFTVGFSPLLRLPRWVAYRIVPGPTIERRQDKFLPDPELPASYQADSRDYADNDYDRGHLIRRADLFGLGESQMLKIFYLSVVVPQLAFVNQKSWLALENYTSLKAAAGSDVYVIRGPIYDSSAGGRTVGITLMGPNNVPVPTHFFQIALIVAGDGSSTVEAHIVPNVYADLKSNDLTHFSSSVMAIGEKTGLSFDRNVLQR